MIKRYKLFSCQCGCGEVDWTESTNGEWIKYEDIINLLNDVAFSSSDVEYKNIQGYYLSLERLRDLLIKENNK